MALNNIPAPEGMRMTGDLARNWDFFKAEFEDYMLATELQDKPDEVKAAALRRLMGSECRHIYNHNLSLSADQKKNPGAIMNALSDYFKQSKNVIYERYMFGCCRQETDEPIDNFLTRLRERAATCEYRQLKDEMIRDRLVLGIASEHTRRRLLRERDLTLVEAVKICRLAEATDHRLKTMDSAHMDSVNVAREQRPRHPDNEHGTPRTQNCIYCGNSHRKAMAMAVVSLKVATSILGLIGKAKSLQSLISSAKKNKKYYRRLERHVNIIVKILEMLNQQDVDESAVQAGIDHLSTAITAAEHLLYKYEFSKKITRIFRYKSFQKRFKSVKEDLSTAHQLLSLALNEEQRQKYEEIKNLDLSQEDVALILIPESAELSYEEPDMPPYQEPDMLPYPGPATLPFQRGFTVEEPAISMSDFMAFEESDNVL